MNTLFLMVGLPGSGKSHWLREHLPAAAVLSPDIWLERVHDYQFTPERVAQAWEWCQQRLEQVLADPHLDGVQLAWDATMTTRQTRAPYIQAAHEAGWQVVAVYLDTPLGTCQRRNAARAAHRRVPDGVMAHMADQLTLPTLSEGFDRVFRVPATGG